MQFLVILDPVITIEIVGNTGWGHKDCSHSGSTFLGVDPDQAKWYGSETLVQFKLDILKLIFDIGKSSFASAVLGEMPILEGQITLRNLIFSDMYLTLKFYHYCGHLLFKH